MKHLFLYILLLCSLSLYAQDSGEGEQNSTDKPAKTLEQSRREIIRYGTETEIANLIQALKNENADYLDDDLAVLARNTRNSAILSGLFSFFGDREKKGLEERALRAVKEMDDEANATVLAALNYLGRVKAPAAADPLMDLLDTGETRFMNAAFRALGRTGSGGDDTELIADYLIDYYTNRDPGEENLREIIVALGELEDPSSLAFLSEIAKNNDERPTRRMAAVTSLSKIADPAGLEAVLSALSSSDPNLRAAAVAALGPFKGEAVDTAILEAFRDSYYRTRIGAAQAAGSREMEAAIPYLRFRAERDEVAAVKDESIKALGAIGNRETRTILEEFFMERKNSDRVRILSAEMLIKVRPGDYAEKVSAELDEAKSKNQTALYNGLLRVIASAETSKIEELAGRFLDSGGVVERSYAMDMAVKNNFRGLGAKIRELTDEKYGSLARKARDTLDKLGLEINTSKPE
ncbi:HEAT repeat domain-containing protein [Treponema sp. OttesenSCG-928-L16]|nr:HEAT repeat domain-containing protein [Treponema sp. OttesenSCG-928-L16]